MLIPGIVSAATFQSQPLGVQVGDGSAAATNPGDNLIYGVLATSTAGSLILLQNGDGNDKFKIDYAGNTTIAGILSVSGKLVCLADGTNCLAATNSGWTDDGLIVRLTTITDKVGIGTTNPEASIRSIGQNAGILNDNSTATYTGGGKMYTGTWRYALKLGGGGGYNTFGGSGGFAAGVFLGGQGGSSYGGGGAGIVAIGGDALGSLAGGGAGIYAKAGFSGASSDGIVAGGYFDGNGKNAILAMNGNVGIGITNPSYTLHVVGNEYVSGNLTIAGASVTASQTASTHFFADSVRGYQIRIDSDNNSTDTFRINNGANTTVLTVDESGNGTFVGQLTVAGKILGVSTPTLGTDAANKDFVDAAVAAAASGPSTWTCAVRSATSPTVNTPEYTSTIASCSGSEKVISGGCQVNDLNNNTWTWYDSRPSSQGWYCGVRASKDNRNISAYANCCQ
ncbi:hypothetical protein BK004_00055 [bacterium CG10_46_32]|nr:MAG: hypothetical protein BK004_00055 [bacterium CG10_46_32]PIR56516.1 MAG: hypothetical protein COU73_00055 [Parcubacteria group bacterium CG10_big_fil_rev_8_21_14_0_10_46_32]